MNIEYIKPVENAYHRMKKALFNPFDMNKWIAIAFTAFLAGLMDGGGGNNFNVGDWGGGRGPDFGDVGSVPGTVWDWLMKNPGIFIAIIFGVFLLVAVFVGLTWLSSRGVFMFLDNVVHDRGEVTEPWKKFKDLANSYFKWRLAFFFLSGLLVLVFLVGGAFVGYHLYESHATMGVWLPALLGAILFFIVVSVCMAYIGLFLRDFVAPIMYKYDISATEAWQRFLILLKPNWGQFLLYGLFFAALQFVATLIIMILGVVTCCIGLFLFMLPFVGVAITLPVWYTFRAFSLEYLAQFGREYRLFPAPESMTDNP